MPQLFDLSAAADGPLNHHLECLCKSMAEPHDPPGGKGDMWDLHPSVFLQQLVEAFTAVGMHVTDAMKAELMAWLTGAMHAKGPAGAPGGPAGTPPALPGGGGAPAGPGPFPLAPSIAWTPEAIAGVRTYLLAKPLAAWTVDDFLLMCELVVHAHVPPGWAEKQADWLAARSGLMAKVEDDHPQATLVQVGNVLAAMPNTVAQAVQLAAGALKPAHLAAMAFGRARAAENIRNVNDGLRHAIKTAVLQSLEAGFTVAAGAPPAPTQALTQQLFDAFAQHNRDWRRIAVTEAGEIKNQGFIGLQEPGKFVRRVERYRGACVFCRNLDGRVFKVVDPQDADKDGRLEVWPGKTNIGRSASPNKRVDGELVPRESSELWWAAAGVQHPHCRGTWVHVAPPQPTSSNKAWNEWLAHLGLNVGGT